jgi:hypothetical protein
MQSVSPFGDPVRLLICSSNGRHRMTGRDNFGAEHILSGWNGAPQAKTTEGCWWLQPIKYMNVSCDHHMSLIEDT